MVMEMEASDIQIKELRERAMIHRKTFYLHYTCIEALYADILSELSEDYFTFSQEEQNIINTFLGISSVNLYRRWVQDKKCLPLKDLIDLSGTLFYSGISSIK